MSVTWPKDQKDRAKLDGKALFGFAVSGKHLGKADRIGGLELLGPMDTHLAASLADFMMKIRIGKAPAEAFAEVDWDKTKNKS
jgi:hypothetical protein